LAKGVVDGNRALDAGCGSGVLSSHLGSQDWEVLGVDANVEAIRFASCHYASENIRFVAGYLDELDIGTNFDLVISFEVVEHLTINQVDVFLSTMFLSLRPGGRLIITTPNYKSAWPLIEWVCDRLPFLPNMSGDQHITRFTFSSISSVLQRSGFEIDRVTTFSTISPFVGVLSAKFQCWLGRFERSRRFRWGSLLLVTARRPEINHLEL
jgi:cyclopropane fatty-acyl-phospholipid synthase-like methyltransferase